jgi:hypothetical protein
LIERGERILCHGEGDDGEDGEQQARDSH